MSRSITGLRCRAWWGSWAGVFYYDYKERREYGRRKRRRQHDRAWRAEAAEWSSCADRAEQRLAAAEAPR